jgi:hypothetical protein
VGEPRKKIERERMKPARADQEPNEKSAGG